MTRWKASVANWLWKRLCEPSRKRFEQSLADPELAQATVYQRILRQHAGCAYLQAIGLQPEADYATFASTVPVVDYDDLAPWIERMKQGERDTLCVGEILAFEKTSGSTSGAKWIPFNVSLRAEFQEAVRAWMGDLHRRHPRLAGGRAWWVVSQLHQAGATTPGGIPIGLANDDEYLGWWERKFASWLRVAHTSNLASAAQELLTARDLRLISVWNPSYLALLWEQLKSVRGGTMTPEQLWPELTIISGWADASAAPDAAAIKRLFPQVTFQPKGLLATEGVVTIPWGDESKASVPALHSHFLEFQERQSRHVFRVHELQPRLEYEVILTTSGGLWRYRLNDIVEVDGFEQRTPRLRFLGRADGGCDLRGEKLHPLFVQQILIRLTSQFAMLAPTAAGDVPGYVLFTTDTTLHAAEIDAALSANPYYAHAIHVGQLSKVRIFLITDAFPSQRYLERCSQWGQRGGTVKATALHRKDDWEQWFHGDFKP